MIGILCAEMSVFVIFFFDLQQINPSFHQVYPYIRVEEISLRFLIDGINSDQMLSLLIFFRFQTFFKGYISWFKTYSFYEIYDTRRVRM